MEKHIARDLKRVDIEIGQRLFSIAKEKDIPAPPSPLQARILEFLFKNEDNEVNQKDIEQHICVSKATISGALFSMEKNGFIKRVTSQKDQRSKQIIITDTSREAYNSLSIVFEEVNKELLEGVTEDEINTFYKILDKFSKNIKKEV